MTDDEIDAQLAVLGLDRCWFDLGVFSDAWLAPDGQWRTMMQRTNSSPPAMLRQALFNYLHHRKAINDVTLAGLLAAAARTSEELSRTLAAWNRLTVEQLAQVIRHDASAPGARRLATQRLRIHALEAGADIAMNLVGFGADSVRDAPDGDPTVFEVGHRDHPPAFRFRIAWEQSATADQRLRSPDLLDRMLEGEMVASSLDDREVSIGIAGRCVFVVVVLAPDLDLSRAVDGLRVEVEQMISSARANFSGSRPPGASSSGGSSSGPAELQLIEFGVTVPRGDRN